MTTDRTLLQVTYGDLTRRTEDAMRAHLTAARAIRADADDWADPAAQEARALARVEAAYDAWWMVIGLSGGHYREADRQRLLALLP